VRGSRSFVVGVGVAVGFGLVAAAACSLPPETTFGNPNTLARANLPGEGGTEALVCGADAGTFDGGCPSFATDVYPYFAPNGAWHCSDKGCHGGTTAPAIDDTSATTCLASLKKITVTGIPYIAATDGGARDGGGGATAGILCNLQGNCGSKMPKPPGKDPTEADLCLLQAWLACGAPP
jgi:hypothetical protein